MNLILGFRIERNVTQDTRPETEGETEVEDLVYRITHLEIEKSMGTGGTIQGRC